VIIEPLLPRVLALFALCSLLATVSAAQSADTLAVAPRSRLRITTSTEKRLPPATFVRQTSDSLVVFLDCSSCGATDSALAWRDVHRVERFAGRQHVKGALIGLAVGTVAGIVAARIAVHDCEQGAGNDLCGLNVLVGPPVIVAGVTIGALLGVERWVRVWPNASSP
jgi:hypothetical protein